MRTSGIVAVVVAFAVGLGIAYASCARHKSAARAALAETESALGVQIQELRRQALGLRDRLSDLEVRIQEEQKLRRIMEESLRQIDPRGSTAEGR